MLKAVYFFFLLTFISCKDKVTKGEQYDVKCDIRLGKTFYSIYLNQEGHAYVIKGNGSFYTEPLTIRSSDTSNVFKLDSTKSFFETLNKFRENPIYKANRTGIAQRAEVYYDNRKVFDSYAWDEMFWDLFRPIIEQVPKGFNPFLINDNSFEK